MHRIDTRGLSDPLPRWHDTAHDQADTFPLAQRRPLVVRDESRPEAEMACHHCADVADTNRRTRRALEMQRNVALALVVVVGLIAAVALAPPGMWQALARWFT